MCEKLIIINPSDKMYVHIWLWDSGNYVKVYQTFRTRITLEYIRFSSERHNDRLFRNSRVKLDRAVLLGFVGRKNTIWNVLFHLNTNIGAKNQSWRKKPPIRFLTCNSKLKIWKFSNFRMHLKYILKAVFDEGCSLILWSIYTLKLECTVSHWGKTKSGTWEVLKLRVCHQFSSQNSTWLPLIKPAVYFYFH